MLVITSLAASVTFQTLVIWLLVESRKTLITYSLAIARATTVRAGNTSTLIAQVMCGGTFQAIVGIVTGNTTLATFLAGEVVEACLVLEFAFVASLATSVLRTFPVSG